MEDFKKTKDGSCYSDNELASQMREKIKQQAQRLRVLEQYRLLCEQRVLEIAPGHPLPVRPEHLGKANELAGELQRAKKKISRLESMLEMSSETGKDLDYPELLQKYNALNKHKTDLEESLRSEMLTCEEQRTYIQVLKQAIEDKSEHSAQAKSEKPKQSEETRKDQTKLKITLLDYQGQVKRLQELLENKESELEGTVIENTQLESYLSQVAEALEKAEKEVKKLEEENKNLLDYLEEHSVKEQEMEKELNELSEYFDAMKNDCEILKAKLEEENKAKKILEIKAEVLQEEAFKTSHVVKDLQSTVSQYKAAWDGKEAAFKKVKEEKTALDIKVESLQSTCKQLETSFKNSQTKLEGLSRQFESHKQAESAKSNDLAKMRSEILSLTTEKDAISAAFKGLKSQLAEEKKDYKELEKLREMDIKQIQDFKQALAQYKSRCETLEESHKQQIDPTKILIITEQNLSQIQEEFGLLQEVYRETQQREVIQSEALNEIRKHNTELSRELEDLYRENETMSFDLARKTEDFERVLRELEKIGKVCESIESDKKRLESHLKGEKNSVKSLKEQSFVDRSKLEGHSKQLKSLKSSYEKALKEIKDLGEEVVDLKNKLKLRDRENEEERFKANRLLEQVQKITEQFDLQQSENEGIRREIVDCCKVVAGFAGKYTVHDRVLFSKSYKEFLMQWKEEISSSPKSLEAWVQSTIEEIENMALEILNIRKDQNTQTAEIKKLSSQLEEASCEDFRLKQENSRLKSQLQQTSENYEQTISNFDTEFSALRADLASTQNENVTLVHELSGLKDLTKKILSENHELRVRSDLARSSLKSQENKLNLLKNEKAQAEDLLTQVQRTIGSSEIAKIYNEIMRAKGELELVEREKVNLECQLFKYESDRNGRDSERFQEITKKLSHFERQIKSYKKNIQILQDDLSKEEMVQELRTVDNLAKNKLNLAGQKYSRKVESPRARQKSSFSWC